MSQPGTAGGPSQPGARRASALVHRLVGSALLAVLLALPARAQDLPALFDVSGVTSGDGLNVRERPEAGAPLVGQLPRDSEDVEVMALSRDGSWGQINFNDRAAWVAMRFLARQEQAPWWDGATPLACYGTEPYWNLRLGGGEVQFDSPDGPDDRQAIQSRAVIGAEGGTQPVRMGFSYGQSFAVVTARSCSDGMSSRANGLAIDLFHLSSPEGTLGLSGCCSLLH